MRKSLDMLQQRRFSTEWTPMIDFDITCRKCGKPMTLRVRDEEARALFEQHGALCEACHEPGFRLAFTRRAA